MDGSTRTGQIFEKEYQVITVHNGARGPEGPDGDPGDKGDQGDGINLLGPWASGTEYCPLDAVTARSSASAGIYSLFIQRSDFPCAPSTVEPYLDADRWDEVGAADLSNITGSIWEIHQIDHGFEWVGTPVAFSFEAQRWIKADNRFNDERAIAVVREVISADRALLQSSGEIPFLDARVIRPDGSDWQHGKLYTTSTARGRVELLESSASSMDPATLIQPILMPTKFHTAVDDNTDNVGVVLPWRPIAVEREYRVVPQKKFYFNATDGQTDFTGLDLNGELLAYMPGANTDVFQNGANLFELTDYTASDGATITLTTPAAAGDTIEIWTPDRPLDIIIPSTGVKLDNIESLFDGGSKIFPMTYDGGQVFPPVPDAANVMLWLDGNAQEALTDYQLIEDPDNVGTGTAIQFTYAPEAGTRFWGIGGIPLGGEGTFHPFGGDPALDIAANRVDAQQVEIRTNDRTTKSDLVLHDQPVIGATGPLVAFTSEGAPAQWEFWHSATDKAGGTAGGTLFAKINADPADDTPESILPVGRLDLNYLRDAPIDGTLYGRQDAAWTPVPAIITDHGALSGLADDDHPQYLTEARGDARYAQPGDIITAHSALTGLANDDHPQYLTEARGDLLYAPIGTGGAETFLELSDTPLNYASAAGKTVSVNSTGDGLEFTTPVTPVIDHGALTGLDGDDHLQYHNDARGDDRYGVRVFLEAETYLVGELVSYQGNVFVCIVEHAPAPFDLTHFSPIAVVPGSGTQIFYEWSSSTGGPVPAGGFGVNNADPALANEVRVSEESRLGNNFSIVWENIQPGDIFGFTEDSGNMEFIFVAATGTATRVTASPDYFSIPVSVIDSGGVPENTRRGTVSIIYNPNERIPVGGTTGQHLAKASDDDYALEWVDAGGGTVTYGATFPATPDDGSLHYLTSEQAGMYQWQTDADGDLYWVSIDQSQLLDPVTTTIAESNLPNGTVNGYQVWGDVLIQWGIQSGGDNPLVVPFPIAYGPQNPSITATGVTTTNRNVVVSNITSTSFDAYRYTADTNTPSTITVRWMAIGEAPDDMKQPKEVSVGGGGGGDDYVLKTGDTMTGTLLLDRRGQDVNASLVMLADDGKAETIDFYEAGAGLTRQMVGRVSAGTFNVGNVNWPDGNQVLSGRWLVGGELNGLNFVTSTTGFKLFEDGTLGYQLLGTDNAEHGRWWWSDDNIRFRAGDAAGANTVNYSLKSALAVDRSDNLMRRQDVGGFLAQVAQILHAENAISASAVDQIIALTAVPEE